MADFESYKEKYQFVRFERRGGILSLILHKNGQAAKWSVHAGGLHDELGQAFYDVGHDPENHVVILSGTGDVFLTDFDLSVPDAERGTPAYWARIIREGKDLLMNLLDIEVPVISAVNGPVFIHSEVPTMADIVLAADHALFADKAHSPLGVVPGDGVHIWWQMLLGPNRGRHFLLTGEEITAHEAKALGFVAEVLPGPSLIDRAHEVAAMLAAKPPAMLRNTRAAFTQHIKRRMLDDLGYGLQLEGMAALAAKHASRELDFS